ncbi:large ribosomal subunit protein mL54 [Hyperolius riggenbachi]|uniref:large ribosomal subunit protein mL54 n=1 Tax=Hyperolius riggenbachi TaxID=752182 RepID=UPI0035A2B39D
MQIMAHSALRSAGILMIRCSNVNLRGYAKKTVVKGKGLAKDIQKGPEVCKEPDKLITHAMGLNIYKAGVDVKLRDDSQYPEWLFQLDLGPPKTLQERSPDTPQYWKLLRKLHMWRNNRLAKKL